MTTKKELTNQINTLFKFKETFEKNKKKNCFSHLVSDKSKQTIDSIHREEFLEMKKKVVEMINLIQVDK